MTSRRALLAVLLLQALAAFAAPDPVLAKFVGSWKTEARIRTYGPPPRDVNVSGTGEAQPTLGGQYVEFRTRSIVPADTYELQVMTYDAENRVYLQWVFDSDGYRHETRGKWNPATSILRWEGEAHGAKLVIDDHWVSPDRLEWSLTRTARDGRLLQRIDGVVSRSQRRARSRQGQVQCGSVALVLVGSQLGGVTLAKLNPGSSVGHAP